MVFALASLFDMEQDPYCVDAQEYYLLARAALRFAPPLLDTTLWSIQSLVWFLTTTLSLTLILMPQVYMALFLEFCDYRPDHSSSHGAWSHLGFAVKLGHGVSNLFWMLACPHLTNTSLDWFAYVHPAAVIICYLNIPLDVNSARWKLDEEATQRRSSIFWQLFHADTWVVSEITLRHRIWLKFFAEFWIRQTAFDVFSVCRLLDAQRSRRTYQRRGPQGMGL